MKTQVVQFLLIVILLFGCKKMSEPKEIPQDETKQENIEFNKMDEELIDRGIDFIARGNEPFWSLNIDFRKEMQFTSLTEISELITPAVEGVKAQDADVTRYRAVTEAGELIVTIIGEPCIDNMSGESFPLTVIANVKFSSYDEYLEFKGCGRYLFDNRLNGEWILTEMNGKSIEINDTAPSLPSIIFDTNEKRIAGSGGCNRIMGSFQVRGDEISFGKVASTMMACPDMDTEREYLKILSDNTLYYKIKNNTLTLEDGSGVKLIYNMKNEVE